MSVAIGFSAALKLSPKVSRSLGLVTRRGSSPSARGLQGKLRFALGTSDKEVIEQVFLGDEFSWLGRLDGVVHIVDCGANIGATGFLLLNAFRRASRRNRAGRGQLRRPAKPGPVRRARGRAEAAVWSRDTTLGSFAASSSTAASGPIRPRRTRHVAGIGASEKLSTVARAGRDSIDLLKVDIEGGEFDLFSRWPQSRPPRVNTSQSSRRRGSAHAFFTATSRYDFELVRRGN